MRQIINVEGLGKRYSLKAAGGGAQTFREAVMRLAASPFSGANRAGGTTFWALRDVTFAAAPGDVVGIVGRNGAGKSTLLKILSRVTEPTRGRVELYGRVGSLLEVGTGFHQDLSGRENIFLNGAILGMSRREIQGKFDDIVAFAEVERFVDTSVKHYSSGMFLRLAFAVAAFLESEILLVDEVLAVGDAAFQKRCLGKIREVSASGRTVLFVSHNMAAVEALCTRCLHLADGQLQGEGTPHQIIQRYLSAESRPMSGSIALTAHPGRRAGGRPIMRSLTLSGDAEPGGLVRMGTALHVQVAYDSDASIRPVLGLVVKNNYGAPIFGINNRLVPGYQFEHASAAGSVTCHLAALPLMPGTYTIDLYLGDAYQDVDVIYDAATFDVIAADVLGGGKLPGIECGPIVWPATWTYEPSATPAGVVRV